MTQESSPQLLGLKIAEYPLHDPEATRAMLHDLHAATERGETPPFQAGADQAITAYALRVVEAPEDVTQLYCYFEAQSDARMRLDLDFRNHLVQVLVFFTEQEFQQLQDSAPPA